MPPAEQRMPPVPEKSTIKSDVVPEDAAVAPAKPQGYPLIEGPACEGSACEGAGKFPTTDEKMPVKSGIVKDTHVVEIKTPALKSQKQRKLIMKNGMRVLITS